MCVVLTEPTFYLWASPETIGCSEPSLQCVNGRKRRAQDDHRSFLLHLMVQLQYLQEIGSGYTKELTCIVMKKSGLPGMSSVPEIKV